MQHDYVCPDVFLAAVLYHEMGHALFDKRGTASSSAPALSDYWVNEEVVMHELEGQVLDAASEGKLARLYDAILARTPPPASFQDIIGAITDDDLLEFDRIFGLEQEPERLASIYLAAFEIGLLFRAVDEFCPEAVRLHKKVTAYRWAAFQRL